MRTTFSVGFAAALLFVLAGVSAAALPAPSPVDFLQYNFNYTASARWQICAITASSAASLTWAEVAARCGGSRMMVSVLTAAELQPVAAAANTAVVAGGGIVLNTLGGNNITWTHGANFLSAGTSVPGSCATAGDGICVPLNAGIIGPGVYAGPTIGWVASSATVFVVFYTNPCEGLTAGAACPSTRGACGLSPTCDADAVCNSTPKPPVPDSCVDTYACDPISGSTAATTYFPAGATCALNNTCVATSVCLANHTCAVASLAPCPLLDNCHDAGVCDVGSQTCSYNALADGTVCSGSSLCATQGTCAAGACTANATAPAPPTCKTPMYCDLVYGWQYNNSVNGTNCTSANQCLYDTYCDGAGACVGTAAVCDQLVCRGPPSCDSFSGLCVATAITSGPCDDGNPCTQGTTCGITSLCAGGTPSMSCGTPPPCYLYALTALNSTTCVCTLVPLNNTVCDDGDSCTTDDRCNAGVCAGTAVTCPGDDCNMPLGSCSPATQCWNPYPVLPVRACNSTCMLNGVCSNGTCVNGAFDIANPSCTPGAAPRAKWAAGALFDAWYDYAAQVVTPSYAAAARLADKIAAAARPAPAAPVRAGAVSAA